MTYKNKKNEVNDKLATLQGVSFCPQENFQLHMFYDGTHLNRQGTAQLVSNYKFVLGRTQAQAYTQENGHGGYN